MAFNNLTQHTLASSLARVLLFLALLYQGWFSRKKIKGEKMISDLMAYALLAFIFVVTGLRMFLDKPNKATEIPVRPRERSLLGDAGVRPRPAFLLSFFSDPLRRKPR